MRHIACGMFSLGVALLVAAAAGCTKIPPPTPLSELNPQQTHGYSVYQQHCVQCHADRTSDSIAGPSLRGVFKKQYLDNGQPANDDRVLNAVLLGYGTMPAMGSALTPQDREDLLAYMHTL